MTACLTQRICLTLIRNYWINVIHSACSILSQHWQLQAICGKDVLFADSSSGFKTKTCCCSELYRLVLVDTPLAPYFSECISSEDLDEMNVEIMRNILYKVPPSSNVFHDLPTVLAKQ